MSPSFWCWCVVCFWHKADMQASSGNVRCKADINRRQSNVRFGSKSGLSAYPLFHQPFFSTSGLCSKR